MFSRGDKVRFTDRVRRILGPHGDMDEEAQEKIIALSPNRDWFGWAAPMMAWVRDKTELMVEEAYPNRLSLVDADQKCYVASPYWVVKVDKTMAVKEKSNTVNLEVKGVPFSEILVGDYFMDPNDGATCLKVDGNQFFDFSVNRMCEMDQEALMLRALVTLQMGVRIGDLV